MKTRRLLHPFAVRATGLAIVALIAATAAHSQILVNPGFEAGLTGWSIQDADGGSGTWYSQTGTASPTSGFGVALPVEGSFAAMTDQTGPGSHVLFQDFVVPTGVDAALLSFSYTLNNSAGTFFTGSDLSYLPLETPNQQARADIMLTGADAFSVASGDVLLNLFQTNPGDPANSGVYNLVSTDVTAFFQSHAGETLRLRFAEADNQFWNNFGVDNVQVSIRVGAVPEPSTYGLMGAVSLLGLVAWRRSRRATQAV